MTLKELRIQSNKSRVEAATALEVTVQAISNYESGLRRINIEQVLILSKFYECTAQEVIEAQLNSCRQAQ